MDYLVQVIHNLTPKEKATIVKQISSQKMKRSLFDAIDKDPEIDNYKLLEALNYKENISSLYTLKNRLLDDIISIKVESEKNTLIITKEKVQNLRPLVYSRDKFSVLRELNKLEKNAQQLELFSELKEIYFCLFLTYRHDREKSNYYLEKQRRYDAHQSSIYKLEELFYSKLLDTQDLFYHFNQKLYKKCLTFLDQLHDLHREMNNLTSGFLYLSGKLTLILNSNETIKNKKEILRELNRLSEIYNQSFMAYKYPNCQVAIECLFSKYFYLTEDYEKFDETQLNIQNKLGTVKGYQMFDCTYFLFLYISILNNIRTQQFHRTTTLLRDFIADDHLEVKSNKMKNYYLYMAGIKEFYEKNYRKSQKTLLSSRPYFSDLDYMSIWVAIDNILLSILICIILKDFQFLQSEITKLKRLMRKNDLPKDIQDELKNIYKVSKTFFNEYNAEQITVWFQKIQTDLNVLRTIELTPDLFGSKK
jgi:hypothetical protein